MPAMAGRKPLTGFELATLSLESRAAFAAACEQQRYATAIGVYKHLFARMRATANRILWRKRTARRASTLGRVWRAFDTAFKTAGLPWRREGRGPGSWSIQVLDPSAVWAEVATVEAPIPQRTDDSAAVRVFSIGEVTLTNGMELRIADTATVV
jgi:hypothetical protein